MRIRDHSGDANAMLLTIDQTAQRYSIGRSAASKLARDNDAIIRFGKSVRVDVEKLDNAIRKLYAE